MKKRRVLWIVVGLTMLLASFVVLASRAGIDRTEQDVMRFVKEHGFTEGVGGAVGRQLSEDYPHSIHYYSIDSATAEQEEAAYDSLKTLADGWAVKDEDEFGAVYVNNSDDSVIYGVEMRRAFEVQIDPDGTVATMRGPKKPGPELLLAIHRNEPGLPVTLWQRIKGWFTRGRAVELREVR